MGIRTWGSEWGERGAVGRRSKLSFQCEEVEGKLDRTRKEPHPKHNQTLAYSRRLGVFVYKVECEDVGE